MWLHGFNIQQKGELDLAYIKEKYGSKLEAKIGPNNQVTYYINDQLVKTDSFETKSIYYIESAIDNWFASVENLYG
jgi:hypothetical protein